MSQNSLYHMHTMLFSAGLTQILSAISYQMHTEQQSSESNMKIWSLKLQRSLSTGPKVTQLIPRKVFLQSAKLHTPVLS